MYENQPLPVKFNAACAFESILYSDCEAAVLRPKLKIIISCYLELLSKVDDRRLLKAFNSVINLC